jgi:hypothetical protein
VLIRSTKQDQIVPSASVWPDREKLAVTQGSTIAINVLVMNLQKLLELLFVLFAYWLQYLLDDGAGKRLQTTRVNIQFAPA